MRVLLWNVQTKPVEDVYVAQHNENKVTRYDLLGLIKVALNRLETEPANRTAQNASIAHCPLTVTATMLEEPTLFTLFVNKARRFFGSAVGYQQTDIIWNQWFLIVKKDPEFATNQSCFDCMGALNTLLLSLIRVVPAGDTRFFLCTHTLGSNREPGKRCPHRSSTTTARPASGNEKLGSPTVKSTFCWTKWGRTEGWL